jgi:hypothetical protein
MSNSEDHKLTPDMMRPVRRANDVPRPRACLRCGTQFESEWSGHRVCKHCQSANAWKSG